MLTSSSLRNEKKYFAIQNSFNTSSNIAKNINFINFVKDIADVKIANVKNKFILNLMNILFEDFTRSRELSQKPIYYSTLNKTFTNDKEIFYVAVLASLIKVVSKNIKLHRDNLSSKFKYYKKIIKHLLTSKFVQVIYIEIEALQSNDIHKEMFYQYI